MLTQDIRKELETLIESLGLELVSLEWKGRAGQGEVQIVIDRDDGVTIKDCETVSRQAGILLDLKDAVSGRYTLKVLSPGLTRELKTLKDFERSVGKGIRFTHQSTVIFGRLEGIADGRLEVDDHGHHRSIALSEVTHARRLGPWEEE